jgi:hypothetical protein
MYQIVWIPKYRYKVLVNGVDEYLKIKMDEVRKRYPEIEHRNEISNRTTSILWSASLPNTALPKSCRSSNRTQGERCGRNSISYGSDTGGGEGCGRLDISSAQWAWTSRRYCDM